MIALMGLIFIERFSSATSRQGRRLWRLVRLFILQDSSEIQLQVEDTLG